MPKKTTKKPAAKTAQKTRRGRKSRSTKRQFQIRWFVWSLVIVAVLVFGIFLISLQSTLSSIGSDPTVAQLSNDGIFQVTTLLNRNKNTFADRITECWNQKNPFANCSEENRITEGFYVLRGERNIKQLDGPYEFNLSKRKEYKMFDAYVQQITGGNTLEDTDYYQIVRISYPKNLIRIEVETINSKGHSSRQDVEIQAQ